MQDHRWLLLIVSCVLAVTAAPVLGISPTTPGAGDVAFTIDSAGAGAPISPLIYGVNGRLRFDGVGSLRLGGNRWTGYNWETNDSNAGRDFFHFSDNFLVNFRNNTAPGEAVTPTLTEAASLGAATNITVPIAGFVSADGNGEVFANQAAPSARWNELRARRTGVAPENLSLTPDLNDGVVYTDEFVNFIESQRQNGQEVLYTLDNEPALWSETHPRLFGETGVTFAGLLERTIDHASAIKDVAPDSKVLGGVTFGFTAQHSLQQAPDFNQAVPPPRSSDGLHFNRYLLENIAAEEARQGRPLVDVLDFHWYPEARSTTDVRVTFGGALNNTPEVVEARVQSTRSLFDPTYTESSFISQFFTRGPIRLLDRIQDDIDELRPGTLISVSEYNFGGGNHISGAIAQADALGIFGEQGVYNASRWPIEPSQSVEFDNQQFAIAAFAAFRNFDGEGGQFGDLSLTAETDDLDTTAIYASRSTEDPNELVLIAINRSENSLTADINLLGGGLFQLAEVYQLTDQTPAPVFTGEFDIQGAATLLYELPAFSVSTIRLVAAALTGDFNADGVVDAADYTVWRDSLGQSGAGLPADANGDGSITTADYDLWRGNYGATAAAPAATTVPEPSALVCLGLPLCAALFNRRRR